MMYHQVKNVRTDQRIAHNERATGSMPKSNTKVLGKRKQNIILKILSKAMPTVETMTC